MGNTIDIDDGVSSSNITLGISYTYDRMNVNSGGIATTCMAAEGGTIHVFSGGQVEQTILCLGGQMILSGGTGYRTAVETNGVETILDDGTESLASIWGIMYVVKGLCANATVYDAGKAFCNGGIIKDAKISGGGYIEASSGAVNSSYISSGGTLALKDSGFATSNTILEGGLMTVSDSATVDATVVGEANPQNTPPDSSVLRINGGYAYDTTVYANGTINFLHNNALMSTTVIRGGAISGGDLLLSSATHEYAGECAIRFENGGTATLSTLTIRAGGLMQVDSRTTVHFQNIVLDGNPNGFTMTGLNTYDPTTGTCRKLLDYNIGVTEEVWTDAQYRTLLNTTDAIYDNAFLYKDGDLYLRGAAHVASGATGDEAFATVQSALAMSPTSLVIDGGDFTATANIPTFEGVSTTINGGVFTTSVCGGNYYRAPAAPPESTEDVNIGSAGDKRNISLTINGGTFNRIVFAGDRVDRSLLTLTRTGNISLTISGGTFNNAVAGAMAVTVDELDIRNKLVGNVSLTIKGGTFDNTNKKSWIYGGSIATTKTIAAGTTTIDGNVTVTLDATDNAITVANLVAGSYGYGKISGNTNMVLTGANNITATGEIWGGCSGDTILCTKIKKADETDSGNREVDSQVLGGSRILTFTGFEGTLTSEANKIRAFSDIEVINGSKATVANAAGGSVNLSDVVNWTFGAPTGNWDEEDDCMLTGNFINDFNGDTLILSGFDTAGSYVLLTDSSRLDSNDIFNAFDQLSAIRMDDNTVSANFSQNPEAQTMTWAWAGESWLAGSLEVNRSTGKMTLVTQAVIV